MTIAKGVLAAGSVLALLGATACARPATPPAPPSAAPVALQPAATAPHDQTPPPRPPAPEPDRPTSSASAGAGRNCVTTYIGGGYQQGVNGMPGIYTPGQPSTICSAPPIAVAPAPVALPLPARAAPVAAPAARADGN